QTATLVLKNGPFTAPEIAALRAFCTARSFDPVYFPGIHAAETNRFNVLEGNQFHESAVALLGSGRDAFIADYKFDITPATDDKPYFFHFFRWATLPELLALKDRGALPLLEWGYPVLVATLIQAVVASLLLVLLPLAIATRRSAASAGERRAA